MKPIEFAAPEPEQLAPLFPGYEIVSLIATGGMGAVYRAIQKSLDRTVAIKILPREFGKDASFCAGFEAEAKAMARLNHPNLIGVYDFGAVDGMLYIIMEFVPGNSLFHAAHGVAINQSEVVRLVTGICNGLAHAHENGVIHRDIKPSNILLDLNAQPKIGDFGLAHPIDHVFQEGQEIYGTPHYTAPEAINAPQSVGLRADVFSVGVMLHELLTGHLPTEDQRPASTICHCDHRFDVIIRKATNPLPENRYASAADIAKDLAVIAASFAPKAARPSAQPPQKGPPRPVAVPVRTAPSPKTVRIQKKKSSPMLGFIMFLIAALIGVYSYTNFTSKLNPAPQPPPTQPSPPKPKETHDNPAPKQDSWESPPRDRELDSQKNPAPVSPSKPAPASSDLVVPDSLTQPALGSTGLSPDHMEAKFDVPAFFEKARKIMQDKANPLIARRDESLGKNIDEYAKSIKRSVRKLEATKKHPNFDNSFNEYIQLCQNHGNRIPSKLTNKDIHDISIQKVENFNALRDEFLDKEKSIDDSLRQSLSTLSTTYILGLMKQIERLKSTDDPAAISQIQTEIDQTRSVGSYFPDLMLGTDSSIKAEDKSGEAAP